MMRNEVIDLSAVYATCIGGAQHLMVDLFYL